MFIKSVYVYGNKIVFYNLKDSQQVSFVELQDATQWAWTSDFDDSDAKQETKTG